MLKKVVIIGAGPAGLFSAYNLALENSNNYDIIIIDKGKDIYKRTCPLREGKTQSCIHCNPCNIMCGFGGAGTFSDCKLSLTPYGVGGNIIDYIDGDIAENYINRVDSIFQRFDDKADSRIIIGKDSETISNIDKKLSEQGLSLTRCPTKHLGTDGTFNVIKNLYNYLINKNNVHFIFNTNVEKINYKKHLDIKEIVLEHGVKISNIDYLIVAPGRSGNIWANEQLNKLEIKSKSSKFDLGFRVEMPAEIIKELTDNLYDMKISFKYEHKYKVRTFCTNPNGFVSEEHYDNNIVLANGHSYADKKSNMTNFAVLVTLPISTEKGKNYIAEFNNYAKNKVVVNNFSSFVNSDNFIINSVNNNTLKSAVSDKLIHTKNNIPEDVFKGTVELLEKLNKIYPGVTNDTTNIYGLEAKFYSDTIEVNNNFETKISGLYCIGDGSGITRGIIQSACCGLVATDNIIKGNDN